MKFSHRSGWTAIPNALLVDLDLSGNGTRLISWLISNHGDFEFSRQTIAQVLGLKETSLRKAIKEAKAAGYLKTIQSRCKTTGQIKSRYEVSADGSFTASGETTCIITPKGTDAFSQIEVGFLGIFPKAPMDLKQFRLRLAQAVGFFGLEYVIVEAEAYALEVASRSKGGQVAKPENWLWRLRWDHLNDVMDDFPRQNGSP